MCEVCYYRERRKKYVIYIETDHKTNLYRVRRRYIGTGAGRWANIPELPPQKYFDDANRDLNKYAKRKKLKIVDIFGKPVEEAFE